MTVADKLVKIAENVPKVYAEGYADGVASGGGGYVDPDKIVEATVEGYGVYLTDVCEIRHDVTVKTTAGDSVTVGGKNLLPPLFTTDTDYANGSYVRIGEDGGITVHKVAGETVRSDVFVDLDAGAYAISNGLLGGDEAIYIQCMDEAGNINYGSTMNFNYTQFTFAKGRYRILVYCGSSEAFDSVTLYPQLERGGKATGYEAYKSRTFVADSSGTVTVKSFSPVMRFASAAGNKLSVTYRKSWGMKHERDAFWDSYQEKGARTGYNYAFVNFDEDTFYPKYDIRPTKCQYLFGNSNSLSTFMEFDLVARLKECGVELDTSQSTDVNSMFLGVNIVTVPTLDLRSSNSSLNLFRNSTTIRSVERIILKDGMDAAGNYDVAYTNDIGGSFNYNSSLEEIRFVGVYARNLDIHWSTKLSRESIWDISYLGNESQAFEFTVTLSKAAVDKAFETSDGANDGSESDAWADAVAYSHQTFNLV